MSRSNLWENHKNKIIGTLIGVLMTSLGSVGTYVYTAVHSYETEKEKKFITGLIIAELTKPETIALVLTDSNVLAAQEIRDDIIIKKANENAVASHKPDSLKLSAKLKVEMDLKVSQSPESEIAWMYRFCKWLDEKYFSQKQGKPKKIKL